MIYNITHTDKYIDLSHIVAIGEIEDDYMHVGFNIKFKITEGFYPVFIYHGLKDDTADIVIKATEARDELINAWKAYKKLEQRYLIQHQLSSIP